MTTLANRAAQFPLGAAITVEALSRDPYPLFHQLRASEPVTWAGALGQWMLTSRDDIMGVVRDADTFRTDSATSPIRDTFGAQMLSTEGEVQRRYKLASAPPFNTRAVEQDASPIVHDIVRSRIAVVRRVSGGDLRDLIAAPVALATVATVLGIPPDLEATLRGWYDTFADALTNYELLSATRQQAHDAVRAFREAIAPILRAPDARASSLLIHLAKQHPRVLDDEEIGSNALIVLFGGIETTEAAITNALWALFNHPVALERARGSDEALVASIEESLRWDPAVQTCTRYAARDVDLRGASIAAGETVQCMLGAANRDPSYVTDPDRYDPWRANTGGHLAFGFGRHFCLGAALARLETRVTLRALFDEFPTLALDGERADPPRGHEFRKPPSLYATWRA